MSMMKPLALRCTGHVAAALALAAVLAGCRDAGDPVAGLLAAGPPPVVVAALGLAAAGLAVVGGRAFVQDLWAALRPAARPAALKDNAPPLVVFRDLDDPGRTVALTSGHLRRALLVTGKPGAGKSVLLGVIAAGYLAEAEHRAGGPPSHTLTFDASRDVGRTVAYLSARHGREAVVIDIGSAYATPLQVPRTGLAGAQGFMESWRDAFFAFQPDLPRQFADVVFTTTALLNAAGYRPEHAARLLLSEPFRAHVLARAAGQLPAPVLTGLGHLLGLPPSERARKIASAMARFGSLYGNPNTRPLFAGPHGGFGFEALVDPDYTGPGLDVIVAASGPSSDEEILFAFGVLFNEFSAVAGAARGLATRAHQPRILLLADEAQRYGAPGAVLETLQTARNHGLRVVLATHSLLSLNPRLQQQVVLHANRIAGAELGDGARATAEQLARYEQAAVATWGPDGRPDSYWSPQAQAAAFADRQQALGDHCFAVRLAGQAETTWARPVINLAELGGEAERAAALEAALARSGRPLAEVTAELEAESRRLDAAFGAVVYQAPPAADPGDDGWRQRTMDDFAPL